MAGRAGRALGLRGVLHTAHSEGHGTSKAGRSMMGCGVAGVAGQWQHAGQAAVKKDAAGPAVRGLLAVIAVARDVLVRHPLPGRCAVYVARLRDLPLCLLC